MIEVLHKATKRVLFRVDADTLIVARLELTDLQDADLRGANLNRAALDDANCSFADLSNANLSEAERTGQNCVPCCLIMLRATLPWYLEHLKG